jgi:alpha-methylacyl-CoA racemase
MGPLAGITVVEFEGLGPGPLAGMLLADMGARVIVLGRAGGSGIAAMFGGKSDMLNRGKHRLDINLKHPEGVAVALDLLAHADALIEGNRPGVMERLGLGPEVVHARNPRLVYGRMTGWGQDGPLAQSAGHDLNYLALTGLMGLGGERPDSLPPQRPPATLGGDAVGAMGLAFGLLAAIFEARTSGRGQVVDAAIVDIAAVLGSIAHWAVSGGVMGGARPSPFYDSPFYDIYECADGKWLSLGPLEPPFYALLLSTLGLTDVEACAQYDVRQWPALKARLQALFKSEARSHWDALLEGTDACYAPVLSTHEAAAHPHLVARQTYACDGESGDIHANPAPRFSRSCAEIRKVSAGDTALWLAGAGISEARLAALGAERILGLRADK